MAAVCVVFHVLAVGLASVFSMCVRVSRMRFPRASHRTVCVVPPQRCTFSPLKCSFLLRPLDCPTDPIPSPPPARRPVRLMGCFRAGDVMSRMSKALTPENYTTDEPSFYQQLETRQNVSPPAASGGHFVLWYSCYASLFSVKTFCLKRWCDWHVTRTPV